MERKTRIICTLGPASQRAETLRQLVQAGMDVARLNFSHGTTREHIETAEVARYAARRIGRPVKVLADLEGPKLRIGRLSEPLELRSGEEVVVTKQPSGPGEIPVPDTRLLAVLQRGDHIFLDDGAVELEVIEILDEFRFRCAVRFGGNVDSHCGAILQNNEVDLPTLSIKDFEDIAAAREMGADFVAQSMVRSRSDVDKLRKALGGTLPIISKIETAAALRELEGIAELSWGLMVARGDLGVCIPRAEVPLRQKEILELCRRCGSFGIVATEMLLSMVNNSRPTRAEVSDVATAVLDGCDAVMLSEETAIGAYPVQAVHEMQGIITTIERSAWYRPREKPIVL